MAWNVDSWTVRQALHLVSSRFFLFFKFSLVGRASEQACQRKVLILFGTLSFQMRFQNFFWFKNFELVTPTFILTQLLIPSFNQIFAILTPRPDNTIHLSRHTQRNSLCTLGFKPKEVLVNQIAVPHTSIKIYHKIDTTPSKAGTHGDVTLLENCQFSL